MSFIGFSRPSRDAHSLCTRRLLCCVLIVLITASGAGCSREARTNRYLARAEREFSAQRFDRAEIGYLNALKLSPQNPIALGRLGIICQMDGRSSAYSLLRQALDVDPDNSEVRL